MDKKVIARPCKEHPGTWEMEVNGKVTKHFKDKSECVCESRKVACECGCECSIENKTEE